MTILSEASIASSALAPRLRPAASMVLPLIEQLAALDLADLGIERDQPAAFDESAFHGCRSVAVPHHEGDGGNDTRPLLPQPTALSQGPHVRSGYHPSPASFTTQMIGPAIDSFAHVARTLVRTHDQRSDPARRPWSRDDLASAKTVTTRRLSMSGVCRPCRREHLIRVGRIGLSAKPDLIEIPTSVRSGRRWRTVGRCNARPQRRAMLSSDPGVMRAANPYGVQRAARCPTLAKCSGAARNLRP